MNKLIVVLSSFAALPIAHAVGQSSGSVDLGRVPKKESALHRGILKSPGGELPFHIRFERDGADMHAWIVNGSEQSQVPHVTWKDGELTMTFDHYDAVITAKAGLPSAKDAMIPLPEHNLVGEWKKRTGVDSFSSLPFETDAYGARFFEMKSAEEGGASSPPIDGRWEVRFEGSEQPAVAVFENPNAGVPNDPSLNLPIRGTILTTGGDYRFLAGNYQFGRLRLSSFDGAHALLFDAKVQDDGSLKGDFWSRDSYHTTWSAVRKEDAVLPDGFSMVGINKDVSLNDLSFPDLDGKMRNLGEPEYRGKVTVLEIFGSWCPNCHDSSALLVELQNKYGPRGLKVVGLAFEITGDAKRDAKMVRKFAEYHDANYPMLLAGVSKEREAAVKAVKMIDRIKAYPTTIFVGPDGKAREVDTGFSGPATGEAYQKLRERYESIIEKLLSESE